MTITESEVEVSLPKLNDPDIDHFVCCEDDNLTFCGFDASGQEWITPQEEATCLVCVELQEDENFCPRGTPCVEQ